MTADSTTTNSKPSPQDNKAFSDALTLTRHTILLLDQILRVTIDSSIHDDLEAELLRVERERLDLKESFRAYKQDPSGLTPPDQATIDKIKTLTDQVDGLNAEQAQAEAILKLAGDVADTAAEVFKAK